MQCETFENRLQQLLDQRAEPAADEHLQRHAAVCPECRAMLDGERRLFDGLALAEIPAPRPGFAEAVVAQLQRPSPRSARQTTHVVATMAALAACLLLALSLRTGRDRAATGQTPGGDAPPQDRLVQQQPAGSPSTLSQAALLPIWWTLEPSELYPDRLRRQHLQQVDRIADDLRPLTSSFSAAAAALRRTIPVGKSLPPKSDPQARTLLSHNATGVS